MRIKFDFSKENGECENFLDRCRRSSLEIFQFEDSTRELAQRYSCSPLAAAILQMNGDGSRDDAEVRSWLSPKFEKVIEGLSLGEASARAAQKWREAESLGRVVVYGDYDVDGVSSTVLAMEIFRKKATDVQYFIPRRDVQGYGLHPTVLRQLVQMGCDTLVVVDCGTKDKAILDALEKDGVRVFVFDHHSVGADEDFWRDTVNPRIDGDVESQKLCATAVLWFWAWSEGILPKNWLQLRLELVALATIADCMPLTLLNRATVQQGMNQMRSQPRQGLLCLFEKLGLNRFTISEEHLSMKVIPCLNAPGRVGCADTAVRVLGDEDDIEKSVTELVALNKKRQLISDKIAGSIGERSEFSHVMYDKTWPIGVLSSVASRICSTRKIPIALAAPIRDQIRGTLRVPEGVNAVDILNSISQNLTAWGGHPFAAGFSVASEKWGGVQSQLEEILSKVEVRETSIRAIELRPSEIRLNDWRLVGRLGPFGNSNPCPFFFHPATGNEKLASLGKGGQHFQIDVDGVRILAFNSAGNLEKSVGWVYHPRIDYWQGEERMQYILDYVVSD